MGMALLCGVLFVTTLAVQQPAVDGVFKGDAAGGESRPQPPASQVEEGLVSPAVVTPDRPIRQGVSGTGARYGIVRSARKGIGVAGAE